MKFQFGNIPLRKPLNCECQKLNFSTSNNLLDQTVMRMSMYVEQQSNNNNKSNKEHIKRRTFWLLPKTEFPILSITVSVFLVFLLFLSERYFKEALFAGVMIQPKHIEIQQLLNCECIFKIYVSFCIFILLYAI